MSTEIFTLIQTQANNNQAQLNNNHVQESQAQPGLFESLINGLTLENELININAQITNSQQVMPQNFPFKNNDSFPESIINILAEIKHESGQEQPAKILHNENLQSEIISNPEKFIAQILNDDNIKTQINSLPEEKQQEILQAVNEFIDSNQQNIDVQAQKLFNVLSENINLPGKFQDLKPVLNPEVSENQDEIKDSDSESDSKSESESESKPENPAQVNINNFAVMPNSVNIQENNIDSSSENNEPAKNIIHIAPHKDSQVQDESKSPANLDVNNKIRPVKSFEELTREINNKPESESESEIKSELEQDSESESNNQANNNDNKQDSSQQNFNGNNNNFTSSRSNPRAINDSRKISQNSQSNNQSERANNNSNNRIESHSNFQAFFEGVLTSRRTVSQNSPAPLNLRANLEFTPSTNLRDGVVNIVRFIRADGVQKANIVIDPPALGRISVELISSSSGVEASIKVSSEQIRQLVQDQINQLRMNLSEQGVQVANFTVDVQQDNQQGQGRNQNNNPYYNAINGAEDDSDLDSEEFRIDLEDGLLYWVA